MVAVLQTVCVVRPAAKPAAARQDVKPAAPPLRSAFAAAAAAVALLVAGPSAAELNRFEGETLGEFNRGTAQQFGGAQARSMEPRRAVATRLVAPHRAEPPPPPQAQIKRG
jgi:hypothetical protein